jgi:hypothetical protein
MAAAVALAAIASATVMNRVEPFFGEHGRSR